MTQESFELPKAYDPKATDPKWKKFWEEGHFFTADPHSSKPAYCIVIPPPNVTGVLHMGHALVNTLQDILIRWKRMSGFETLWVPGTDHAGIATQTVVERHLLKSFGKRRDDYSREEFLKLVWEWKEKHEQQILEQLKRLGASCDFSRLSFTMDEKCSKAVKTIFKRLYEEGLIYRGDYLVNWDPITQTALADDEVEYEERDSFIWTLKYPLSDGSGTVSIATTRPETMLGDVAIAVSPKDPRYMHLIGKTARLPFLDRELPIIADHHVDPAFGTGMVKITPAHDPNDYRIGIAHNLPSINILTPSGNLNENAGPFQGMTREEARSAIVSQLKELGYLEKVEKHKLRVGVSYRSKAVIEPYLSKQWFVKMEPFIPVLRDAVNEGKVKILPKEWEHTYFHWVNNLRDWCISRQLWWGHRIPVWYKKDDHDKVICYAGEGLPPEVAKNPDEWQQDADVLDTWFSSALWPFSTLGWPDKTPEFAKFYPNAVLVTGHDILFFWVARMILMGSYANDQVPFPETFLHGLIYGKSYWREEEGRIAYVTGEEKKEYDMGKPLPKDVFSKWEKLSKSKGNVIDPLEMIDEYGTDAVRLSLAASANQGSQIDLDRRRFEDFKNFANKVWNGARFVFMNLEGLTTESLAEGIDETLLTLEDKWILSLLNQTSVEMNQLLGIYAFDQASLKAYDFFWKELCAYYLEISKPVLFGKEGSAALKTNKQKLLVNLLAQATLLLHPFAPFITEELFQLLKSRFTGLVCKTEDPYTKATAKALLCPTIALAPYPTLFSQNDLSKQAIDDFAFMEKIVHIIRNIRGEMKIPPSSATDIYIVGSNPLVADNTHFIRALVKTGTLEVCLEAPKLAGAASGVIGDITILIPMPPELAAKEKERLEKEQIRLQKSLQQLSSQLQNAEFLAKAKPELVTKLQENLQLQMRELEVVSERLSGMS